MYSLMNLIKLKRKVSKLERKSPIPQSVTLCFIFRCDRTFQLHDGADLDDQWGDMDTDMHTRLLRAVHAPRVYLFQTGQLRHSSGLHGPLKLRRMPRVLEPGL